MDRERVEELRVKLRWIIFGVNTPSGRLFDVALLWAILISVACVALESVTWIRSAYGLALRSAEWAFTILFTIEYGLRIWTANRRKAYITSFFGIVDLVSILPTYVAALVTGSHSLSVVRGVRLIRVFRVLKLVRHLKEAHQLLRALQASRPKIVVFLSAVLTLALITGTVMYELEGEEAGFTSIPTSVYWAIVTMTTVGYGDIAPRTALGQFVSACLMVLGYAIIAVPTGIVSMEFTRGRAVVAKRPRCAKCGHQSTDPRARFCSRCGARMARRERGRQ